MSSEKSSEYQERREREDVRKLNSSRDDESSTMRGRDVRLARTRARATASNWRLCLSLVELVTALIGRGSLVAVALDRGDDCGGVVITVMEGRV